MGPKWLVKGQGSQNLWLAIDLSQSGTEQGEVIVEVKTDCSRIAVPDLGLFAFTSPCSSVAL